MSTRESPVTCWLLDCYARGVFPMGCSADDPHLFVVDPDRRGILPLDAFRPGKTLIRLLRRDRVRIRINTAFGRVIRACAAPAAGRRDSWINQPIIEAYDALHIAGHAHSVECWQDGELTGGLYGVALGGAFFGESMFSYRANASKLALAHLVARLLRTGFVLLDIQFVTEHLRRFGAEEVSRATFQRLLGAALSLSADFSQSPSQFSGAEVVQLMTQTS